MRDIKETLVERLHECNQHKIRLLSSQKRLRKFMPLSVKSYESFSEMQMSVVDQMIFRFSKLQDSMGEKLFASLLELSGEDIKRMTFIDRLNRLEELELLYRDEWLALRKVRNEIAHEYSFNQDEVVDSINLIFDRIDKLLHIYETLYRYAYEKFDFLELKR